MHVLVTGGTGFIGRPLCAELRQRGHRVSVLTRSAVRAAARLGSDVRCIERLDALAGDPPEGCIHLAGENLGAGRWTPARKRAFVDSRVHTTRHLVDGLARFAPRPRVLISASAIGWYGARGDEPLTEEAPPGAQHEFTVQLCQAWEDEARRAEAHGLRVCRVRIGIVLERDGGSLARMWLPFRLGLGGPIGSGAQWMSWIHRADLVALLIWLLENPAAHGVYNGTAPEPVTNRTFTRALGRALHRPAWLPMPGFVLRLVLGEMADIVLTGQRVVPQRALEQGFVFRYPELSAALAAIAG
ncbi:hypothetical protein SAMN04488120_101139 [Fontimonas thermophila]|uniref:TIGR01777 family protein n=1 Tax=Fontimonas thermophila TaxID=1076937 RepID=A0A1I2H456_9GAMM|nr:TIGR01777 family oxidoreductase [Fontimonas thermophila]SFF24462.1 hypothetical protein SAMN04488120_101139 [Fontimonas thermophila]